LLEHDRLGEGLEMADLARAQDAWSRLAVQLGEYGIALGQYVAARNQCIADHHRAQRGNAAQATSRAMMTNAVATIR
jgi:hypothetical protein